MTAILPDVLSTSLFSRVTTTLRNDLNRVALEAVTGRRDDVTLAASGRNAQVHRAQTAVDQAKAADTRLALIAGRYTTASSTMKNIRELTENLGTEAMQAATSGSRTGVVTTSETAEGAVRSMFQMLNVRFDGRALFAGDEGNVAALAGPETLLTDIRAIVGGTGTPADKMAQIDAYFADGGTFDTTIYNGGDNDAARITLPNGIELSAIPRADQTNFRDLLKGMVVVAASMELPPQEIVDWVRQGASLIRSSQDRLVVDEAQLGETLNRLSQATSDSLRAVNLAEETIDRIVGRDAFEAASDLQNLETRLEAAYSLTSRMNRLSLVNFLR